jgi:ABC-type sugar transport system permease subunit
VRSFSALRFRLSPTLFCWSLNVIYGLQVFESVLIMTDGGPAAPHRLSGEKLQIRLQAVQNGHGCAYSGSFALILAFTLIIQMQKNV